MGSAIGFWPEHRAPITSPFDLTEPGETRRRLEHTLLRVAQPMREALLLMVVEGLTTDEVATILDLRPDAVRQRVSRARGPLRDALEAPEPTRTPNALAPVVPQAALLNGAQSERGLARGSVGFHARWGGAGDRPSKEKKRKP